MPEETVNISLRAVTPENFKEVITLQVREDQKKFVASNLYSLAEAYVFPQRTPLAIYADETLVGFLMYAYIETSQNHWIFRLMIAADQQARGYGREAMRLLIDRMRAIPGCSKIYISYEFENDPARTLYASLGFHPNGEVFEDEEIAVLTL